MRDIGFAAIKRSVFMEAMCPQRRVGIKKRSSDPGAVPGCGPARDDAEGAETSTARARLTQTELAERSHTNTMLISKLECGVTTPIMGKLLRLANALECEVVDLVRCSTVDFTEIAKRVAGERPPR